MALLIHRFSAAFKAPIMVCVSKKTNKYAPSIISRKITSYLHHVQNQVTVLVKNQYEAKKRDSLVHLHTVHIVYPDDLESPGHYSIGDSIF